MATTTTPATPATVETTVSLNRQNFTDPQPPAGGKVKAEKVCPITLADFTANAGPLPVTIGGILVGYLEPKQFSTGSFGWGLSDKYSPTVGDVLVKSQLSVSLTVVNSNPNKK